MKKAPPSIELDYPSVLFDLNPELRAKAPPSRDFDMPGYVGAGARKEKQRERPWKHSKDKDRPYVELRAASAFSFLDGSSPPEDLIDAAADRNVGAMALIDTNGVYGAPRFYGAAKKAGVRALVGAEVVLDQVDGSRLTVDGGEEPVGAQPPPAARRKRKGRSVGRRLPADPSFPLPPEGRLEGDAPRAANLRAVDDDTITPRNLQPLDPARLTLLVESRTGYRNLCRLLTSGALGRPKGEARYDWDLIALHAEGIHCLTGGDEGPVARALQRGGAAEARQLLDRLRGIFNGRVHVELQRHGSREEEHRNVALVELARSMKLPLVATNGIRYARRADKNLHDVLTCIRKGTTLDAAGRLLRAHRERYVKSGAEMAKLFADLPEAIDHTVALGQRLDFTLADLGYQFPEFPLPDGETPMSFLRQITWDSARVRFRPLTARAQAQVEKELNVIEKLDLAGYFLIVWDIVRFCQRERIMVQGRGSAANSAVCYALGITAVDPVKMDLLFERFLSEERGEWPDIDLDLPSGDQRERVIQHVYETYGARGAAMTANVITYRDRSAAREVAKSLGYSPEQVDRFAKAVGSWGFGEIRDKLEFLTEDAAAAGFDIEDKRVRHLLRLWMGIQNLPRHLGQHSGGMVMARGRLDDVVPLEPASMPGRVVIQWDKDDCADLGIIKVDLLGLGMLAAIEKAIPLIKEKEGIEVDLAHLPQNDPGVFDALNRADTVGWFQVESRAQMASLPRNAPKTFYDIVVQVAIIRPGPIVGGMVHPFFDRRQGKAPVEYPHPSLEPILKRTLGVPLFQEQLLRIAMVAAGFTGGEAEELRRAMGFKRSVERMEVIERRLRAGMEERGITGATQDQIVKSITSFALYGFPESHAASFALIAYASGYLKVHHPAAFYVALLNAWPMGFYHPASLVKDAQRHGTPVLPIDVMKSGWECRWENGGIRMGIRFVKGIHERTGRMIEAEAALRPFRSIEEMARRCSLRDDQLTKLADAGALTCFGMRRRDALWQAARVSKRGGPLLDEVESLQVAGRLLPVEEARQSRHPERSEGSPSYRRTLKGRLEAGSPRESAQDDESRARQQATGNRELSSPLPQMSSLEETIADYRTMDLTAGPHLMEHYRNRLKKQGIVTAAELSRLPSGRRIATAGAIIVRQRPGTAKGFVFLTLEDETGMSQAIIKPDLFRENRSLIVGSSGIVVEGILQNGPGQPSLRAERFWSLDQYAGAPSHDFH